MNITAVAVAAVITTAVIVVVVVMVAVVLVMNEFNSNQCTYVWVGVGSVGVTTVAVMLTHRNGAAGPYLCLLAASNTTVTKDSCTYNILI